MWLKTLSKCITPEVTVTLVWELCYGLDEIVTQISDLIYMIKKPPNGKPRTVHINRKAPYKEDNGPLQQQEVSDCRLQEESNKDSRSTPSGMNDLGVTRGMYQDFFIVKLSTDYPLTHVLPRTWGQSNCECLLQEIRKHKEMGDPASNCWWSFIPDGFWSAPVLGSSYKEMISQHASLMEHYNGFDHLALTADRLGHLKDPNPKTWMRTRWTGLTSCEKHVLGIFKNTGINIIIWVSDPRNLKKKAGPRSRGRYPFPGT